MHGDLQLAAGGVADVLGERDQVHRMRIVGRIGRREIPFGLRQLARRAAASAATQAAIAHVFISLNIDNTFL